MAKHALNRTSPKGSKANTRRKLWQTMLDVALSEPRIEGDAT